MPDADAAHRDDRDDRCSCDEASDAASTAALSAFAAAAWALPSNAVAGETAAPQAVFSSDQRRTGADHARADAALHAAALASSSPSNLWRDPAFPPSAASLVPGGEARHLTAGWDALIWSSPEEALRSCGEDQGGEGAKHPERHAARAAQRRSQQPTGPPRPCVFHGAPSPGDVLQGALGDCYLLSSLSVLADCSPSLVEALLPGHEQDVARNVFCVRLCVSGHHRRVLLDGFTPCFSPPDGGGHAFAKGRFGHELWPALVEKAFAKALGGCYAAIEHGDAGEALTTLTGAPCEFVPASAPGFFDKMVRAAGRGGASPGLGWPVVAMVPDASGSSQTSPAGGGGGGESGDAAAAAAAAAAAKLGLVPGHAYGVLDAREVALPRANDASAPHGALPGDAASGAASSASTARLLLLRNPWGGDDAEWVGAWGWGATEWEGASGQAARSTIGASAPTRDPRDGRFWMEASDFEAHFAGASVCRLWGGWGHNSVDVRAARGATTVLILTVPPPSASASAPPACPADVVLHQPDARGHPLLPLSPQAAHRRRYACVRLSVVRAESPHTLVRASAFSPPGTRDALLPLPSLLPGRYWLLIDVERAGASPLSPDAPEGAFLYAVAVVRSPHAAALDHPPDGAAIDGCSIWREALRRGAAAATGETTTASGDIRGGFETHESSFPDWPAVGRRVTKRRFTAAPGVWACFVTNASNSAVYRERLCFTTLRNVDVSGLDLTAGDGDGDGVAAGSAAQPPAAASGAVGRLVVPPRSSALVVVAQAGGGEYSWATAGGAASLEAVDGAEEEGG